VYVDDIPAPKDCLYGAFIYSTFPRAYVKGINFKPSLASQKVIAVITAKDIPSGGENIGSSFPRLADEALFADQLAEFACHVAFQSLRLLKHRVMLIWLQNKLLSSIAQKICSHQF